MKSVRV